MANNGYHRVAWGLRQQVFQRFSHQRNNCQEIDYSYQGLKNMFNKENIPENKPQVKLPPDTYTIKVAKDMGLVPHVEFLFVGPIDNSKQYNFDILYRAGDFFRYKSLSKILTGKEVKELLSAITGYSTRLISPRLRDTPIHLNSNILSLFKMVQYISISEGTTWNQLNDG